MSEREKSWFLLSYRGTDHYLEKRKPHRKAHIELSVEFKDAGHLVVGGAFPEPPYGASILFHCESIETVEDFVRRDPYAMDSEVVESYEIRPITVVAGTACPNPITPEQV